MSYKRRWQPREKHFVQFFAAMSSRHGCHLVDIPDAIISRRQTVIRERQRPCDSVLITPNALYLIEFKVGSNKQSLHQRARERIYNEVNENAYFVVQFWESVRGNVKTPTFDIKQFDEILLRTTDIDETVLWFKNKEVK